MARAACYLRQSKDRGEEQSLSLAVQRRVLTELCQRRRWTPEWYDEGTGVSGATIEARPVFQRLLRDATDAKIDVIAVIETTRLCRAEDLGDFSKISRILGSAGVMLVTPDRDYDFTDSEAEFDWDLRSVLSKGERTRLRRRTMRGRREAKDRGRWLGGNPPWGYRYGDKGLEPDPEKRDIVRRIFLDPRGFNSVATQLISEGIDIQRDTVRRMRRNAAYMGMTRNSAGHLIQAEWEPIVTEEEWKAIQLDIDRRKPPTELRHLLSSLLKCDACRTAAVAINKGQNQNGPHMQYGCRKCGSITGWALETVVRDAAQMIIPGEAGQ